ncbi:hypothetical protein Tco_1132094 [Tanacetum coccineum]|uniref:Reverse transcriptase domain-containing protein n=1 Tax=Tanacetum coccineum TaxID=301880 RepID=A0ABQ5JB03_9ASTR
MVRALILDKKNQTPAPASVKAIEQSCVTCGGGHSYQNCPATNDYRDNIQEYVSQAAAVNYNQGNASYRPQMVANQIRPPGFPLCKTIKIQYGGDQFQPKSGKQFEPKSRTTSPALDNIRMILELADRTISTPTGIAEDVFVKVGTTCHVALLDVPLVKYMCSRKYLKVLKVQSNFYLVLRSVLALHLSSLRRKCRFLMEEIDEFLESDDSIPPGVDGIYDSEGDTVYLEELLSVINSDPNLPPSPVCEINCALKKVKSSCEDPSRP